MAYIPWGDHRGGRLELALMVPCLASSSDPSAARPEPDGGCVTIEAREFHLPIQKLGEFTGTLYEAAGQPVPLILARPQTPGTASVFSGGHSVGRDPGAVTIMLRGEELRLTPDKAREFAAAIAARASEAEDEQCAATVLADLITAVTGSGHGAAHLAETILRAGYTPPEATP